MVFFFDLLCCLYFCNERLGYVGQVWYKYLVLFRMKLGSGLVFRIVFWFKIENLCYIWWMRSVDDDDDDQVDLLGQIFVKIVQDLVEQRN